MSQTNFQITDHQPGSYLVRATSIDGTTELILDLTVAEEVSDGRLGDNTESAHQVMQYLLSHQDAGDLPDRIDISEVVAAYPDLVASLSDPA